MTAGKRKTLVFLAAMACVLALFVTLSMIEGPPRQPADTDHRLQSEASCTECHSKAGKSPLGMRHTDRPACLKCHKE